MPSPRHLAAGLAAAALLAAPAMAQQACLQPVEKTAFEVRALQSQLMVAALSCAQQDEYNQFVTRFRSELGTAYRGITTHYRRTGGPRHQQAMDGYITSLANAQSQDGIRQGTNFCRNVAPMMASALALPTDAAALATFSQRNNLSNPHGRGECAASPVPAATTRASAPRARRS